MAQRPTPEEKKAEAARLKAERTSDVEPTEEELRKYDPEEVDDLEALDE